jgi:hypothetical protein
LAFVFVAGRLVLAFIFDGVDIGVEVAIGVALTTTAVFAFAFRIFALVFTLTAVSPQAVKPATASESAIIGPVFLIMVSSVIPVS